MALLTHLKPSPDEPLGLRLLPRFVDKPVVYRLYVHGGFIEPDLPFDTVMRHKLLAQTELHRHFMHPDVKREEVEVDTKHGKLRGAYFYPRHARPHSLPAVLDLFGGGGGLIQHRAAMLANHGFASFALAYMGYNGTPDHFDISLELVQDAIDWLNSRPQVTGTGAAMVGTSLGGVLAIMAGTHLHGLRAVIAVNGDTAVCAVHNFKPITWKGKDLTVKQNMGNVTFLEQMLFDAEHHQKEVSYRKYRETVAYVDPYVTPIEKSPADIKYMFLCSVDDDNVPSVRAARVLQKRWHDMKRNDADFRVEELEGAGHLLEPPYVPHTRAAKMTAIFGDRVFLFGGNPYDHARAQDRAWWLLRQFITENVAQPMSMIDFNELMSKM